MTINLNHLKPNRMQTTQQYEKHAQDGNLPLQNEMTSEHLATKCVCMCVCACFPLQRHPNSSTSAKDLHLVAHPPEAAVQVDDSQANAKGPHALQSPLPLFSPQ